MRAGAVIAANTGLTAEEIGAAVGDAYAGALRPEYVLLCRVADELSIGGVLSDATLSAMLKAYDAETCRKLVLMVSWFNLVNRFENGCRVPFESEARVDEVAPRLVLQECRKLVHVRE